MKCRLETFKEITQKYTINRWHQAEKLSCCAESTPLFALHITFITFRYESLHTV